MPVWPGLRASRLHATGTLTARVGAVRRGRGWATEVVQLTRALARSSFDDRVAGLAAEVAFFAMLGLFPALLASAAVLGSLESVAGQELAARAQNGILTFLDRVFTDDANGVIDSVRALFTERRTGLLTIGALVALVSVSRAFLGVMRAVEVAYGTEQRRRPGKSVVTAVLLAIGSVVVFAVVLTMLVLGPLLGGGPDVARALGLGEVFATFWQVFRAPLAFAVTVAWATTVFHAASPSPHRLRHWRNLGNELPGALLSATLWLAVSLAFRLYLQLAGGANPVFGILGGAMILLVWLYLLGIGLLLGGELNALLARRRS